MIQKLFNRLGIYSKKQISTAAGRTYARGFDAAATSRLFSSWTTTNRTLDYDLKNDLRAVRARSRELSINNDYARKYLKACVTNIIGKNGIGFQSKVKDPGGDFDKMANDLIESAWKAWGSVACVDGQLSWLDIQRMSVESMVRDGEILIRKVRGYDNKFNFALQLIEADCLDETHNEELSNGNKIRMGIEFDAWEKPIAYYILAKHPGDGLYAYQGTDYARIPANEIIHLYNKERPAQSRGFPWMVSAMQRLNMLHGYEESELVSARVSAGKMGFFTSPDGDAPGTVVNEKDDNGDFIEDAEPGTFQPLPEGYKFEPWDPTHPSGNFKPFIEAVLRGAAAGLGITYHTLSGDLTGVNYSSGRLGSLDERDFWLVNQKLIISRLCAGVFGDWLDMAILTEAIPLPYRKIEKFNAPAWQARQFDWVDPLKDIKAQIMAVKAGLKTHSEVAGEQGQDFQEIVEQLAWEYKLMKDKGLLEYLESKEKKNVKEN